MNQHEEQYQLVVDLYSKCINPFRREGLEFFGLDQPVIKAVGSYLYLADGRRLLDFCASFGAATLGHTAPELLDHLVSVLADSLPVINPWGISSEPAELADRLLKLAPEYDKVYFALSGAEGIETAGKLAMAKTGRMKFLSMQGGYHGSTCAATALSDNELWHGKLPGRTLEVDHFSGDDIQSVAKLLETEEYAAVVFEAVQCMSGRGALSEQFLLKLSAICRSTGTVLVCDEVMTGLGRCGAWLSYQALVNDGFNPDICVVSKGLTGGLLPISAVLMTQLVYDALFGASYGRGHGSTFSSYRIGTACGLKMLDLLEAHGIPQRARTSGEALITGLKAIARRYSVISAVNGLGLSISVRIAEKPHPSGYSQTVLFLQRMIAGGVLATIAPCDARYVRFTPPLNVSEAEIGEFLSVMEQVSMDLAG